MGGGHAGLGAGVGGAAGVRGWCGLGRSWAGGDGLSWSWGWCPRGAHGTIMPLLPQRGRGLLLLPHHTGRRGHEGHRGPENMAYAEGTAPHRLCDRRCPGARDGSGPDTSPLCHALALQGAPLGADPSCRAGRSADAPVAACGPVCPTREAAEGPGRRRWQRVCRRACHRRHGCWTSLYFPGACRHVICRVLGPPCLGGVPSRPQGLTPAVSRRAMYGLPHE